MIHMIFLDFLPFAAFQVNKRRKTYLQVHIRPFLEKDINKNLRKWL
jgi:hypothetical protein